MSNLHLPVQTVHLTLQGTRASWLDSGVSIARGEGLIVHAPGAVKYGGHGDQWGFPEGSYDHQLDPDGIHYDAVTADHVLDSSNVRTYAQLNMDSSRFSIPSVPPYSMGMVLLPVGVTPGVGQSDAVNVPREWNGDPLADSYFGGASAVRVWFLFNDTVGDFGDNSGAFDITVQRLADTVLNLPPVRGGRSVPPMLQGLLRAQSQHPAWCWVVQPKHGAWEYYTSLDVPLSLGAFLSVKGEPSIPAATYLAGHGVDLTTIPVTLKMETGGTDVTVLYFDRGRLRGGYYDGAQIEVFEVDWQNPTAGRWIAFSGLFGNGIVGDLSATLELSTWEVAFASSRAKTITYSCPYNFCEGMCHNAEAGDGPTAGDWTRAGVVTSVGAATLLTVQMSGGFLSNGAREAGFSWASDRLAAWAARLNEGRLSMGSGASSDGFTKEVKLGKSLGGDSYQLELRGSFPHVPLVGDVIALRSGCAKTPTACQSYRNFLNYGGFPFLPLAEGMRRIDT